MSFSIRPTPTGRTLREQAERGNDLRVKVPPVRNSRGYSKDQFRIDPEAGTVGCPAGHTVPIRPQRRGGQARFSDLCRDCPLRAACTTARGGQVISINPHEAELQHAKARQREPDWQQAYRAHRPIVERKISHFTRRPWGRAQSPMPRPGPHPHRHPYPSRRDQPRPPRHPRAPARARRLGHRLTPGAPLSPRAHRQAPVPSQPIAADPIHPNSGPTRDPCRHGPARPHAPAASGTALHQRRPRQWDLGPGRVFQHWSGHLHAGVVDLDTVIHQTKIRIWYTLGTQDVRKRPTAANAPLDQRA